MQSRTCVIDCWLGGCSGTTVTCPSGWACEVLCDGDGACDQATVECPDLYACSVRCSGEDACDVATIRCGSGPCRVSCMDPGPDTCDGTTLECGTHQSIIGCESPDPVNVVPDPASSCACEQMGC